jgi:AraC-like DNA-binding protein
MSYVAKWVAMLDARGVSLEEALQGTSVNVDRLEDPAARVSVADLVWLITNGYRLTEDTSLGLELGLELKPTAHSWFGIAIMTASTVGEATELGARYLATRAAPWRMHLIREGNRAAMQFDEIFSLGPARQIVLECLLGGGIRLAEFLLGDAYDRSEIVFHSDAAETAHHARFRDQLPRVRYNMPKLQAWFPAAWLDRRLFFAEPLAVREAVAALDHELRLIGETDDWLERTRAVLAQPGNRSPDLDSVASMLDVSSRTLRRHLLARGARFHELRDEARRARGITLLEQTAMSLDAIAHELGYADAAGFTRAFQRWTGEPPMSYRRRRAG